MSFCYTSRLFDKVNLTDMSVTESEGKPMSVDVSVCVELKRPWWMPWRANKRQRHFTWEVPIKKQVVYAPETGKVSLRPGWGAPSEGDQA